MGGGSGRKRTTTVVVLGRFMIKIERGRLGGASSDLNEKSSVRIFCGTGGVDRGELC